MTTVPVTPQRVPGPHGLPLLGGRANMLTLLRQPFKYMRHLHDTYGDVVGLAAGDASQVMVFGPAMNFQVLSNPELFHGGTRSRPAAMR